jgi:hypothetical protein
MGADAEAAGDGLVAEAFAEAGEDFLLTRGQRRADVVQAVGERQADAEAEGDGA